MAKTYSFVDLPQPTNCVATPTAGGTLVDGTTYYYRVIGTYGSSINYWYGKSKSSAEFSGTADATNKSMTLTFDSPIGENLYYRIFRSTTSDGQLDKNTAMIDVVPSDAIYNSGGTVTFVDNGIANKTGNYCFEIDNDTHGRLTLGGSTSADPFEIVDLYDADQLNGWGVVTKSSRNVYKINCHLIKHAGMYWEDTDKTIEFCEGMSGSSDCHFEFGSTSGDRTSHGCNIISNSPWLVTFSWGELHAYRTTFAQINVLDSNLAGANFSSGLMQDCTADNFRNFYPSGGVACTFKNCIFSRFDNLFNNYVANFDGVKCLSGSRVWQIAGSGVNVVARGVYGDGCMAVLVINATSTSSLTIIDSVFTTAAPMGGNYTSTNGFRYYDQFSYNLTIYEADEVTPIEGATVTMYNNTEEIFSVNTDSNGEIAEQFITRIEGDATYPNRTYEDKFPYRLVITKDGKETYEENFTQLTSEAIVKIVGLKKSFSVMTSTDGKVAIKVDAKNSGVNRDKIIIN